MLNDSNQAPGVADGSPRRNRVAFGPGSSHVARLNNLLTRIEGVEKRARALEARRVALYAEVRRLAADEASDMGERGEVENSMAYRSVQAEIAASLHVSEVTSGKQLQQAHLLSSKYPGALSAMKHGEISPQLAEVITRAGDVIGVEGVADSDDDAERRAQYEALALEKAKQTSPAALRQYARRIAERFATVPLDERYQRAKQHRMVWVSGLDDGLALLNVIMPAHHAKGALSRIRTLAKQLQLIENKAHTDAKEIAAAHGREAPEDVRRTRSQIQADIVSSLLLNGNTEVAGDVAGELGGHADFGVPIGEVRGIVQVVVSEAHLAHKLGHARGASRRNTKRHSAKAQRHSAKVGMEGARPAGDLELPELESYGPIPVSMAREVAGTASKWLEVSVDPATGTAHRVEPRFPSLGERQRLIVRDASCRWVGCTMPAHMCDVDHTVDYARGGPTTLENLGHLCRNHHLLKHHGGWRLKQNAHGDYELRTPTGRTYRTEPASRVRFTLSSDTPDTLTPPG